jgi:hypothetical protein
MASLMFWANIEGIKRRCDDKCHSAEHPRCACICGGGYHGASKQPGGVKQVQREQGKEIFERACALAKERAFTLGIADSQLTLI